MNNNTSTQDSEDLEALFDSILAANTAEQDPSPHSEKLTETKLTVVGADADVVSIGIETNPDTVINQIGHMARTLHDTLRDLGLSKSIVKAAASIPDAKDRLNYVATLTENAAERVLNATEAAQPLVEKMEVEAHRLSGQWQLLFEKKLDVEQFKSLVTQTQSFLHEVPKDAKATNAYLMEIMMAQDFQDLGARDFRLRTDSRLVGKYDDAGRAYGQDLNPTREYAHPHGSRLLTSPAHNPGAMQTSSTHFN